jgi:hypothetical protein
MEMALCFNRPANLPDKTKTEGNRMNAYEMKSAIQNRLRKMDSSDEGSFAALRPRNGHWIRPVAVAATGAACVAAAATVPLTTIHILPIVASALGGASFGSALTVSMLTKAGIVICGTGFAVPLGVPAALAATLGGAISGSGVWLWEMAHRTASVWALGLHWVGIGLVVAGLAYAVYLALGYALHRKINGSTFAAV